MKRILLLYAILLMKIYIALAQFTPGNIVIYRVGDGSGNLVNTGNPVFLDEYTATGTLVQSVALPTSASIPNRALVASGTATSEGLITKSTNGKYLMLTGYDGTAATSLPGTTGAAKNRVVGRVDAFENINTTTALEDFASGNNPRSAISTMGTDIWIAGGSGGVRYTTLGTTPPSTSTQLSTTPTNIRQVNIFGDQLYISTNSGTAVRIGTVGGGLPITSGHTITNLPGFPTTGSPFGFFISALDNGLVLYVAYDDIGITKYSLVSGSWVSNGTVGVDADDYRGLTGEVNSGIVRLFATRKGGSGPTGGGELVSIIDGSGYNGDFTTATITLLATASPNTAFRGVTSAPIDKPTNHPTNISAFGGTQQIQIQFTASTATTGELLPTGYLIKGSTVSFDDILDPADETYYPDAGFLIKNLSHSTGILSHTFTGVTTNCPMYYKIFPYVKDPFTQNIYYKTDGTVLQISGSASGNTPNIMLSSGLDFGSVPVNTTSHELSYILSANSVCTGNVTITPPTGYEISTTSGGPYSASAINITAAEATAGKTIYVVFKPTAASTYNANIAHTYTGSNNPNLSVTGIGTAVPTISISGTLSNFGNVVNGQHSTNQTFTLSGGNLIGDVTVTAPANFQVSKNGTTFSSSITYVAGTDFTLPTLSGTTVYVRFSPSSGTDGLKTGNITCSSAGATDKTIAVSGTEIGNTPTLSTSGTIAFFKPVAKGFTSSTAPTFTVSGLYLTGNVTVIAPANFQVSKNGTSFSTSITYIAGTDFTLPTLTPQTVYVRFAPTSGTDGIKTGNIQCSTPGGTTQNVSVGGKEIGNTITPILTLRTAIDANKLPTTLDTVTVKGMLYGVNTNPGTPANGRFQYTVIDATAGIGLFSNSSNAIPNMPTNHAEGDSVIISAAVTHFNGLMQLTPYYITRLNQGNARKTAVVVTAMNETTESDFIELQNVSIPTPAQWIGSSTNTNAFNVNIIVNSKTYVMRIEPETELATKTYSQVFGSSTITSGITIRGIGGQFDNSNPRDTGYQINPYKLTDIIYPLIPEINVKQNTTNVFSGGSFTLPAVAVGSSGTPVIFTIENQGSGPLLISGSPKIVVGGANASEFSINETSTLASVPASSSTTFTITFSPTTPGSKSATISISNNDSNESTYTFTIYATANAASSVADTETINQISVYPNPSNGIINIENVHNEIFVRVINTMGTTVSYFKVDHNQQLDLSHLTNGVYYLHITNNKEGNLVKKIVIK